MIEDGLCRGFSILLKVYTHVVTSTVDQCAFNKIKIMILKSY